MYSDTWKEVEKELTNREKQTAKDWHNYCKDLEEGKISTPLSFDTWYTERNIKL